MCEGCLFVQCASCAGAVDVSKACLNHLAVWCIVDAVPAGGVVPSELKRYFVPSADLICLAFTAAGSAGVSHPSPSGPPPPSAATTTQQQWQQSWQQQTTADCWLATVSLLLLLLLLLVEAAALLAAMATQHCHLLACWVVGCLLLVAAGRWSVHLRAPMLVLSWGLLLLLLAVDLLLLDLQVCSVYLIVIVVRYRGVMYCPAQ